MSYSSTTEDLIYRITNFLPMPAGPFSSTTEDLIVGLGIVMQNMLKFEEAEPVALQKDITVTFPLYSSMKVYVNGYLMNRDLYTFTIGSYVVTFVTAFAGGETVTISNC